MYAKVSDGTSEGISIEQMNELSAELQEVIDSNDLGQVSTCNTKLMGTQKYDDMIAFNQQAIVHYRLAAEHGMDMMDDNIWEATEILYEQTGDAAHVEAYKTNSPNGAYLKKANKLLK